MGVGGGVGLHGLSSLEEGTEAGTAAPQASGGLIGVCLGGGRMRQQLRARRAAAGAKRRGQLEAD